jgi:ElaB/YqjD/DUF883 family membrane-anchored ribosome-binding protein
MASTTFGETNLSERKTALSENASRQMDRAIDTVEQAAVRVGEQGKQMMTSVDRTVREQPLLALAAVAAVGIVIGALWKMESSRRNRWY